MRIVGGRHRGRSLTGPKNTGGKNETRPTSDRVRESIFNILAHGAAKVEFKDANVVDVFAGTGAMGLEAISRGAAHATFIDTSNAAIKCIRANAGAIGEARTITVLTLDGGHLPVPPRLAGAPASVAFLDPPYQSGLGISALRGLATKGWIEPDALCVLEVAADEPVEPPRQFEIIDERTYGAARVIFLRFID